VDAHNLVRHLDDPRKADAAAYVNEALKQIAYADRVLLNKRDLVGAERLLEVEQRVRSINPFAQTVPCAFGRVDLDTILNVRGYEAIEQSHPSAFQAELLRAELAPARAGQAPARAGLAPALAPPAPHAHAGGDGDGDACAECRSAAAAAAPPPAPDVPRHEHDPSVRAIVLKSDMPVNLALFERHVGELLWEGGDAAVAVPAATAATAAATAEAAIAPAAPESTMSTTTARTLGPMDGARREVFRVKGVVDVAGSELVHVIQGVHETFEVQPSAQRWGEGDFALRQSRIVVIGRGLDAGELTELLLVRSQAKAAV
jgi:G3E family GTPase